MYAVLIRKIDDATTQAALVEQLVRALSTGGSAAQALPRLRLLSTLHNALPADSALRADVLLAFVQFAADAKRPDIVPAHLRRLAALDAPAPVGFTAAQTRRFYALLRRVLVPASAADVTGATAAAVAATASAPGNAPTLSAPIAAYHCQVGRNGL